MGWGGTRNSLNFSRISVAMVAMSVLSSLMRSEISDAVFLGLSFEWSSSSIAWVVGAGVCVLMESTALFIWSTAEVIRLRRVASSVLITCNSAA